MGKLRPDDVRDAQAEAELTANERVGGDVTGRGYVKEHRKGAWRTPLPCAAAHHVSVKRITEN